MKTIVTIVGARPQFIKASVVSQQFRKHAYLNEILVHTGQHFDENMSDIFFDELRIQRPDYFLGVSGGEHGAMTGQMLEKIEQVLQMTKPDAVLVYGDTNSTLAGALAAIKLHIPIAHVEAGVRSFNMSMPEEVNRIITDRVSKWLFVPTTTAITNLKKEGVSDENIIHVGDVMFDAVLTYAADLKPNTGKLIELGIKPQRYVLATIHRAENTDDPVRMEAIINGLVNVSSKMPVVLPMHPRTRKTLKNMNLLESAVSNLRVTEPLGYLDVMQLEKYAAIIATDSGGIQKEAFFHQTPCITLRDETEWTELVEAGWNTIIPPVSGDAISSAILDNIGSKGRLLDSYGDGKSAEKIVEVLAKDLI